MTFTKGDLVNFEGQLSVVEQYLQGKSTFIFPLVV